VDEPSATETVYGNLLVEHHNARRKDNTELADRIFAASMVMLELWPDECAKWEARFSK
jgi:hypothetical protein